MLRVFQIMLMNIEYVTNEARHFAFLYIIATYILLHHYVQSNLSSIMIVVAQSIYV